MTKSQTTEELAEILTKGLESHPRFEEIKRLIFTNVEPDAEIYLIGGAVSRTLVNELYGTPTILHDFDFVTSGSLTATKHIPDGWIVTYSKFNNPTFVNGDVSVDLWPISSQEFVKAHKLLPTIENLFKGVAFTIQALGYDLRTKELVGEVGIAALKSRTFAINNLKNAMDEAKRKGVTVQERMLAKAKSMAFNAILPK